MTRVSPEQGQAKWLARLSAATADAAAGADRVTEAPGAAAARKRRKWAQNVAASEDKWARNVGRVSLEDWRSAFKGIGVQRIAQGATAKQAKYGSFAREFYAHLDQFASTRAQMDDTTFEGRLAIMVAQARHAHQFRRSGV